MSNETSQSLIAKLRAGSREALILSADREFTVEPDLKKFCDRRAFINGELIQHGMQPITDDEVTQYHILLDW